ncbi:calcium-binding allergen Ole e 8-like protein [Tanacetum coccineum]
MATETNPTTNTQPSSVNLTNMEEVKKVFNRFDTNHDGKISSSELISIMKTLGSNTSDEQVKQMMTKVDTDNDGFINLEEFAGFCKGDDDVDDGGLKELHEAFDLYDLNKNGLISSTELHQILTRLGESVTVEDCVGMIKSVDADGDGFVNFDEFKKMMSNGKTE